MRRFPSSLARSPLVEVVFELRFKSNPKVNLELLPGLMFVSLGQDFPSIGKTVAGSLPQGFKDQHPELKYSPEFTLSGNGETVQFGSTVLSLNVSGRYPGWSRFRDRCMQVATAFEKSGFVSSIERYSLKYINIIKMEGEASPLGPFTFTLNTPGYEIRPGGFKLRFEIASGEFVSIVECVSSTEAKSDDGTVRLGTLLSIDTINETSASDFWSDVNGKMSAAHDTLERLFFDLLTPETIDSLDPSYD